MLQDLRDCGDKSVAYNGPWTDFNDDWNWRWIQGKKKRVFFDYDMQRFLEVVEYGQRAREENSTAEG